jgi:hypothetical protein
MLNMTQSLTLTLSFQKGEGILPRPGLAPKAFGVGGERINPARSGIKVREKLRGENQK